MWRVDTGTVDLYFALGHLFGQRGEIGAQHPACIRAIDRPDLSPAPRQVRRINWAWRFERRFV